MEDLKERAEEVREACLAMSSPLIVHHYDADGISAAAIVYRALRKEGKSPRLLCLNTLNEEALDMLEKERELIFVDLGSNSERVKDMNAVIIDHHGTTKASRHNFLNPNDFGYDGGVLASSSSLAWLVFKENRRAALIGAAGDMQMPFRGLNEYIAKGKEFREVKDLMIYGRESRTLTNLLSFSIFNMDYKYVKKFLGRVGINGNKKFIDLSEEEKKRLREELVLELIHSRNVERIEELFGVQHELADDFYGVRDLREIATMLNSCGRYGRPWLGIKFCIYGKQHLGEVKKMLRKHKYEVKKAKKLAKEELKIDGEIAILDGRDRIKPNIIGVVCSSIYKELNKITLGIAKEGEKVKLSLRCPEDLNANETLSKIVSKIGGVAGGHRKAGGAEIDEESLDAFIDEFRKNIKGLCISK